MSFGINITPEAVSGDGFTWPYRPACQELIQHLKPAMVRRVPQGRFLPLLIFDDLGIAARYWNETEQVHSLLLYLATSRGQKYPQQPFRGVFRLNDCEYTRPVRIKDIVRNSQFAFKARPSPVAIGKNVSVQLCPKFEFVGVVDVIWEVA